MKLIYVAGKYTATTKEEVKKNIVHAEEVAKMILLKGWIPVIPHKITSFFDLDPRFKDWDKNRWLTRFCFPLLAECHAICMCKGWENSPGARAEFEFAKEHDIVITFESEDTAQDYDRTVRLVGVSDSGYATDSSR